MSDRYKINLVVMLNGEEVREVMCKKVDVDYYKIIWRSDIGIRTQLVSAVEFCDKVMCGEWIVKRELMKTDGAVE